MPGAGSPRNSRLACHPPQHSGTPQGLHLAEPSVPAERSCRPSRAPLPASFTSREPSAGLKAKKQISRERILTNSTNKRKIKRGNLPSTCFFSVSRAARAVLAACCSSRMVVSFLSPAYRSSSYDMPSWTSPPVSRVISTSQSLSVAGASTARCAPVGVGLMLPLCRCFRPATYYGEYPK
jgi:hypothetical protein